MSYGGGGGGESENTPEEHPFTMDILDDDIGDSPLYDSFGTVTQGPGGKDCDRGPRSRGHSMKIKEKPVVPEEPAEEEADDQEGKHVDKEKRTEEISDVQIEQEALERKVIFKKALNSISLEICVRPEAILNEELTVVHPTEDAIREGLTAGQLQMTIGIMVIVVVKTALDKDNTVSAGRTGDVSVNQGYRFFTSDEIGHVQLHKHSGSGDTVFNLGDAAAVTAAGGRIFAARKGCNFVHVANLADVGTRAGRQVLEVPMEVMDLTVGGDMLFILTPTGEIHIRWALGDCQLLAVVPPMAGPLRSMVYRDGKLFAQA